VAREAHRHRAAPEPEPWGCDCASGRGTIDHLLVMPVRPLALILAKLWSMGLVVLPLQLIRVRSTPA
jgi:hypothetical protein